MRRALIIEDNRIFREAFKDELVRRFPFVSIHEAEEAREAMEKIRLLAPALVFLDICLPGVNGLQLARRIRDASRQIRIAMLTGHDLPEYRRAASQCGVDRFFTKDSLDWKEIEEFVQRPPEGKRPVKPRQAHGRAA